MPILVPLNPLATGHLTPHVLEVREAVEVEHYAGLERSPAHSSLAVGALEGWQLHLPYASNPLPMNGSRGNPHAHAAKVRKVRETAYWLATQLPRQERIRVHLVWEVVDQSRRRDPDNLGVLAKALVDGLRDDPPRGIRSIVADDTPEYVDRLHPRIHYAPRSADRPAAYMRLHIWPLTE